MRLRTWGLVVLSGVSFWARIWFQNDSIGGSPDRVARASQPPSRCAGGPLGPLPVTANASARRRRQSTAAGRGHQRGGRGGVPRNDPARARPPGVSRAGGRLGGPPACSSTEVGPAPVPVRNPRGPRMRAGLTVTASKQARICACEVICATCGPIAATSSMSPLAERTTDPSRSRGRGDRDAGDQQARGRAIMPRRSDRCRGPCSVMLMESGLAPAAASPASRISGNGRVVVVHRCIDVRCEPVTAQPLQPGRCVSAMAMLDVAAQRVVALVAVHVHAQSRARRRSSHKCARSPRHRPSCARGAGCPPTMLPRRRGRAHASRWPARPASFRPAGRRRAAGRGRAARASHVQQRLRRRAAGRRRRRRASGSPSRPCATAQSQYASARSTSASWVSSG